MEEGRHVSDNDDRNAQIINEFRSNGGDLGGAPLLLLHTIGAKSGKQRVNPVEYQQLEGALAVFGSKAGSPTNPDWYFNLLASPDVTVEIGTEIQRLRARVAEGAERARIWARQKELRPNFANYELTAGREIPVVLLEKIETDAD